jgi:hypothetical protein
MRSVTLADGRRVSSVNVANIRVDAATVYYSSRRVGAGKDEMRRLDRLRAAWKQTAHAMDMLRERGAGSSLFTRRSHWRLRLGHSSWQQGDLHHRGPRTTVECTTGILPTRK